MILDNPLIIRADASHRIGTGHVMRCLSLAQSWQRTGGKAVFAMAETTPALEQRLQNGNLPAYRIAAKPGSSEDAGETINLAKQNAADWVVADGYHFTSEYQRAIKEAGLRLLLIDDYGHAEHYFADLILNQNLSANAETYRNRETYTRLLLGTQYVLLREQFLAYRDWKREIPAVARKVLVTLGGADPDNVTAKIITALQGLDIETIIVVGGSNHHFSSLSSSVRPPSLVIRDISNMPELMAWADVAIAAGGTTSWELAFMGLPSLVIVLADNQIEIAAALQKETVVVNLGWHQTVAVSAITQAVYKFQADHACRAQASRHGRQLVDGLGVGRVVQHLVKCELVPAGAEVPI